MRASILALSLFSAASFAATLETTTKPATAVVILNGDSKVKGTITLSQEDARSDTIITYNITGLDANAARGFHVHVSGDLTKGCAGAAGHYNPFSAEHGAPKDENRHVGDLGNIQSDASGFAVGKIEDPLVKLIGPTSVYGRAIVVHGGTDDLGKGASADSKKTGNAGARPACGVIVHAD
jgi:Cu-Zn family superoxide dismutase